MCARPLGAMASDPNGVFLFFSQEKGLNPVPDAMGKNKALIEAELANARGDEAAALAALQHKARDVSPTVPVHTLSLSPPEIHSV